MTNQRFNFSVRRAESETDRRCGAQYGRNVDELITKANARRERDPAAHRVKANAMDSPIH